VLIAALISTIDSALNSLSTVFTMDIYIKKFNPEASQRAIVKTGRVITLVGAVIAIFLTLAIDRIKGLNLFDVFQAVLGFIAPPMSVVFLFGVLWKKTSTRAVNLVLSAGTAFSLGTGMTYFLTKEVVAWPHFLLLSFYIFLILAVLAFLISYFDKKETLGDVRIIERNALPKPTRKVLIFWIALIISMISLYIIFNNH